MKNDCDSIIDFWFSDRVRKKWWDKDEAFDQEIGDRFSELHEEATKGKLANWRETALGRLAEIIVLDQFSVICFAIRLTLLRKT